MKIAFFEKDAETGKYIPANKFAVYQAAILSKMRLDRNDLINLKSHGIRVTYPNGVDIITTVTA